MTSKMRLYEDIASQQHQGIDKSESTKEQIKVEKSVLKVYKKFEMFNTSTSVETPFLNRKVHVQYLKTSLKSLPQFFECLDASQTWICYWILNSLWLLNDLPEPDTLSEVVKYLSKCQHEDGGYGGGPGQYPHLATTYAAINALSIIGTEEAYNSINRPKLQTFLWSVKSVEGGFAMHKGGEIDTRGTYCALAIAHLSNVYTKDLFDKTAEWIVSCQTYEGGFGSCQGTEAHGGYTFCAIAGLALLGRPQLCDIDALLRWVVNKQMKLEGGFQGRTNKLVDGCYSFWQGGIFPIIHTILLCKKEKNDALEHLLFNEGALQEYILICCECPTGGFVDKPGKRPDLYHTNYVLSGLSVAQHSIGGEKNVLGHQKNELNRIHPIHCIAPHLAYNVGHYFMRYPAPVNDNS